MCNEPNTDQHFHMVLFLGDQNSLKFIQFECFLSEKNVKIKPEKNVTKYKTI